MFVPLDTTGRSHYLNELFFNGILNDFAFDYVDRQRTMLRSTYKSVEQFKTSFTISPATFNEFVAYADKNGVKPNAKQMSISESFIKLQLKALIGRNLWGNSGFFHVIHEEDNVLKKALEVLHKK